MGRPDADILGGRGGGSGSPLHINPGGLGTPEGHTSTPKTGLLLGNLGKIRFNFFGVCRVIFDDNIKNGDFQEVGTTPPIEKALVN